jgi:hypothetical protein
MMATLDGSPVFGLATNVLHTPHANAQQINQFFGINGSQTLFGGTRGRTFMISGVLIGATIADINSAETQLLSFADGLAHTLVDNRGREFDNVIFRGEYSPFAAGPRPLAGGGYCLPYKAVFEGLT